MFRAVWLQPDPGRAHHLASTVRGQVQGALTVSVNPGAEEICDGIDNNCDDQVDEGLEPLNCEITNEHGTCSGFENCDGESGWGGCTASMPQAEVCDGEDNNCDGQADEGISSELCEKQLGVCAGTSRTCLDGDWTVCDYGPSYSDGQESACDQLDDDCDGLTDEDAPFLLLPEIGPLAIDGIDNNCNGLVDEIGGVSTPQVRPDGSTIWIDTYESTLYENPDCTGTRYGANVEDYPVKGRVNGSGPGRPIGSSSLC